MPALPPAPQLFDDMRPLPSLFDPPVRFEDQDTGFDWVAGSIGFALGAGATAVLWSLLRSVCVA